eukprot:scaffold5692_cov74-Phaeocystis_antarctica.AAC.1
MRTLPETRARSAQEAGKRARKLSRYKANQACTLFVATYKCVCQLYAGVSSSCGVRLGSLAGVPFARVRAVHAVPQHAHVSYGRLVVRREQPRSDRARPLGAVIRRVLPRVPRSHRGLGGLRHVHAEAEHYGHERVGASGGHHDSAFARHVLGVQISHGLALGCGLHLTAHLVKPHQLGLIMQGFGHRGVPARALLCAIVARHKHTPEAWITPPEAGAGQVELVISERALVGTYS